MTAERLNARRVAQIEPEDFQPMTPVLEVRLGGVTQRGVARETGADDELRAGPQKLDAGLITDLHAPAGEQRDASAQVRQLGALAEVQLSARGTELVVEVMNRGVVLLADVAVLRLDDFAKLRVALDFSLLEVGGRIDVRRGENFLATQLADAGFVQPRLIAFHLRHLALTHLGLHETPALADVGAEDVACRLNQPGVFLSG